MTWNGNGKKWNGRKIIIILIVVIVALAAFFMWQKSLIPIVTIAVEPSSIIRGETATLTWNAEKTQELYLGAIPTTIPTTENAKQVNFKDSIVISPQETTTYVFTAIGKNRSNAVARVTLTVVEPLPIIEAKVEPFRILRGQKSVLSWQTANTDYVEIEGKQSLPTGTLEVSPTETTIYTLKAVGPGGETSVAVEVVVFELPPPKSGFYMIEPPHYYEAEVVLTRVAGIYGGYKVIFSNLPVGVKIRTPIGGRLRLCLLMPLVREGKKEPDAGITIRGEKNGILLITGNELKINRYEEILWDLKGTVSAEPGEVVAEVEVVKKGERVTIQYWSEDDSTGGEFMKNFFTYLWQGYPGK